ncbi:N-6 DNA methylase [Halorussus aquaticus]|uniref:site-specific DNA-methyltransferase (adenine-specific) n=1 Tax=Halorussus aquaticus TaxID=2953748 RepID=A0ABD5Q695_9EURY|nr:N-6 DNA methylase [Halorussus aquaticus]
MSDRGILERWGRESASYDAFTSVALDLLETDERVRAARAEWEEFVTTSHGDVFEDVDVANPRDELFVDALYYDFVVDQFVEFAEREFGFTLVNPEPSANSDALSVSFRELHRRVAEADGVTAAPSDALTREDLRNADTDFLRTLYEGVVSREIRLALGEYYTPRGVAELAVDAIDADDFETATFLDPGCGSGVFPAVCIDRKIAAMRGDRAPAEIVESVTDSVVGIDLNPVAVKSTKLNYLLSLLPVLEDADVDAVELPVFLTDALGLSHDGDLSFAGETFEPTADYLVGNPPWIPWGRLSEDVKDRWRATDADLDLLPHDGADSRLGYANDDVSIPYVWVCIHRYLTEGGGASFVMKRDIMTGPAGKLLRTLTVGDRPLALERVHDFNRLRPFGEQVGANAAIYAFRADADHSFPIDATSWTAGDGRADFATVEAIRETLTAARTGVVPVDDEDTTSAWIREDAERGALGECAHDVRHGVKDDAQDVFSISREELAEMESAFVYPYIKSKHVVKYGLFGHELRLVPMRKANEDNEGELKSQYPKTYDYLQSHREALEDRASSWLQKGPFYNVFGLGDYTWSEYKVVWCRLGFKPHFAVVSTVEDDDLGEKLVVPGDHYMFVAAGSEREAHFLCALLNSAIYQRSLKNVASEGKASLSKTVVSKLELPKYRETEASRRLADLSMRAHEIVPEYTDTSKRAYNERTIPELATVQAEIDRTVEEMLTDGTLFSDSGQSTLSTF